MSKECKEELVSIIIPVYNTPKQFLEECLESIRKQRYKNIEVIIWMMVVSMKQQAILIH